MIPILFDKDYDLIKLYEHQNLPFFTSDNKQFYVRDPHPGIPDNYGLGALAEAVECIAKSELNGQDEITLKYPITGQLYNKIELRSIIAAKPDKARRPQPYRVYRITKPIKGYITIYARHIAYDLGGVIAKPYRAKNAVEALQFLKESAMTSCPFTFATNLDLTRDFEVKIPTSIWDLLGNKEGQLLDIYGGEYVFDGYEIRLLDRAGADNGVRVRYGVNMTDFEQDANCASCYTGVVGYWAGSDDEVVYTPVVAAPGTYGYSKITTVDFSRDFDERPTVQQLEALAELYIQNNSIGIPDVSWKINFVPLDQTEEYKDLAILESVSLGDTVKVIFEKLNVDATAKVVGVEWDVLKNKYANVELGSVKSNLAGTIAAQTKEIGNMPTRDEVKIISSETTDGMMRSGKIVIKSTGALSEDETEYGDCSVTLGGSRIEGYHEASLSPMWQLGTVINQVSPTRKLINGDLKIFAYSSSGDLDPERPALWFGGEKGAFGFIIRDVYNGYNGSISIIYSEDTGMLIDVQDNDGQSVFKVQQNGLVKCRRLIVNDHEIT